MSSFNLHDLKENFNNEGILICFAGPFSHSIIEELGNAVKRYLESEQMTKATLLDVFSIFIEQTQNVRSYAEQKAARGDTAHDFNSGIIVIGKSGDGYMISSGNIVVRSDIERMITHIEQLNGLDKQELKAAYKEQMRRELPPGATGAGLGLIDMARKCREPLGYSITDLDDTYSFFSLKAII